MKFRLQGITDLSTIDWPGKLAAVVFLQGCDLRCPWCQNVEGIDPKGGREADTEWVIKRLKGLKPMIDSVVLTGGEPLFQPKACFELLRGAKELGLNRAIETNGSKPRALRQLLPWLDFVAIDIKAPLSDPKLYDKVTGSTGTPELTRKIRECVMLAVNSEAEVEARTTIVPTLNDEEGVISRIAGDIKGIDRLRFQQFRNLRTFDPSFQKLPSLSREKLLKLARATKRGGIKRVEIFTIECGLEIV